MNAVHKPPATPTLDEALAALRVKSRPVRLPAPIEPANAPHYTSVRSKLVMMSLVSFAWLALSVWLARPWTAELSDVVGWPLAWFVIGGVALVPGSVNAFLFAGLLFDRRPHFRPAHPMPPVSVLIAAYNEEASVRETLDSFRRQRYDAPVEILVIDDGSTDATRAIVTDAIAQARPANQTLRLIDMPRNGGKARALNAGLALTSHALVVTVDADTLLFKDALTHLVTNQLRSPPNTAATAGTVLVRNSRVNILTKIQEWDYFLGIAVVKRVQSLLQGTMVAQGALSVYRKDALVEVGGWQDTVGEDIVLTWALAEAGYRIGYAENAFVFTNVPETYREFFRQRKRWARGLMEAFRRYPGVLHHFRLNTPFVYLNLAFPYLDFVYLFAFVPGVVLALVFHMYIIVGLMTLLLIPIAVVLNSVMFNRQKRIFEEYGLKVRRNVWGMLVFTLAYQLFLTPATLCGYAAEVLQRRKSW
jgi:poly-beta-1,6-N-acetyl-D-glucosamine synthase